MFFHIVIKTKQQAKIKRKKEIELTVAIVGGDITSFKVWLEPSIILYMKDLVFGTVVKPWSTSCIFGIIRLSNTT